MQEAHDFALIAQAAALESRIPFLHFFDGFRTSHEIAKVTLLTDAQMRAMIDLELVFDHRSRALDARPSGHARHRPESGRLFPVARARQSVLPRLPPESSLRRWSVSRSVPPLFVRAVRVPRRAPTRSG